MNITKSGNIVICGLVTGLALMVLLKSLALSRQLLEPSATEAQPVQFSYGQYIEAQGRAYRDGRQDAIRECALFGYVKLGEHKVPCMAPFPIQPQEL